jgi:hypothetical protein
MLLNSKFGSYHQEIINAGFWLPESIPSSKIVTSNNQLLTGCLWRCGEIPVLPQADKIQENWIFEMK